jgi:hypothetical protein
VAALSYQDPSLLLVGCCEVYLEIKAAGWKRKWFVSAVARMVKETKVDKWWFQVMTLFLDVLRRVDS